MALFLSKLLGRKKQEDKLSPNSESSASPLEGKFEYVIPTPSAAAKAPDYPHLSLNLPERRESRVLTNVFGNEDLVGKTRLSPEQTLVIVRACSQAIIARGLETLGIMHPHWHSASPAAQQRLILLFIQESAAAFESEITSTRSPHDVAAVLRWAFRHLQLPGTSFGNDPLWYNHFFELEKSASYPPKSFSEILAPQLQTINLELLTTTLDLLSSLAAHAEANSISGSKLSKVFGFWLLTAEKSRQTSDFLSFYEQWDRQGRILEHLFLSHIRNEVVNHRLPKRLVELVKHYPYTSHSQPSPERDLLPRPRFSTRRCDALFVHVATEIPPSGAKFSKVPLQIVSDALKATIPTADTPPYSAWRKIQDAGVSGDEESYSPGKYSGLGRILSDETLAALSLLTGEETQAEPSINFLSPVDNGRYENNTRSRSHVRQQSASSTENVTEQQSNLIGLDWNTFSTSGFLQSSPLMTPLAETLLDSRDTEVTSPSVTPSRKGSRKSAKTPNHPSRRSLDVLPPITIPSTGSHIQVLNGSSTSNGASKSSSRVTNVALIPLDEAFIDFWNDSLLDPITDIDNWPKFVICRLKASVVPEIETAEEGQGKKVEWMVVEQEYVKPTPPAPAPQSPGSPSREGTIDTPQATTTESAASPRLGKRASSPRPSLSSVNASVKRFSFWGGSKRQKGEKEEASSPTKKKRGKDVKIGEMGEILAEEESASKTDPLPKKSVEIPAAVKEEKEDLADKNVQKDIVGEDPSVAAAAAVATGVAGAGIAAVAAETGTQPQLQNSAEAVTDNSEGELVSKTDSPRSEDTHPVVAEKENEEVREDTRAVETADQSQHEANPPAEKLSLPEASVQSVKVQDKGSLTPSVPFEQVLDAAPVFAGESKDKDDPVSVKAMPASIKEVVEVSETPVEMPQNVSIARSETLFEPLSVLEPTAETIAAPEPEFPVPATPEESAIPVVYTINSATKTLENEPEPSTDSPSQANFEAPAILTEETKNEEAAEIKADLPSAEGKEKGAVSDDSVSADILEPNEIQDAPSPTTVVPDEGSKTETFEPVEHIAGGKIDAYETAEPVVVEATLNVSSNSLGSVSVVENSPAVEPITESEIAEQPVTEVVAEVPVIEEAVSDRAAEEVVPEQAAEQHNTTLAAEVQESVPVQVAEVKMGEEKAVDNSVEGQDTPRADVTTISNEEFIPTDADIVISEEVDVGREDVTDESAAPEPIIEYPAISGERETETAEPFSKESGDVETVAEEAEERFAEQSEHVADVPIVEEALMEHATGEVLIAGSAVDKPVAEHPLAYVTETAPNEESAIEGLTAGKVEEGLSTNILDEIFVQEESSSEPGHGQALIEEAFEETSVDKAREETTIHSDPLRSPGPAGEILLPEIPVVDAPAIPPATAPVITVLDTPIAEQSSSEIPAVNDIPEDHLPPAPETVVLSGETPGPQLALSSSETVAALMAASAEVPSRDVAGASRETEVEGETSSADVMDRGEPMEREMVTAAVDAQTPESNSDDNEVKTESEMKSAESEPIQTSPE
ncbi:hypothetical protein GYMLUDRAFT_34133 [Collybiopsis luxurians FD-317 M1]|nr:hypothetical protein GYMLUDRAFT_34133 [Collybiopsis luxurians FD-317 M1]